MSQSQVPTALEAFFQSIIQWNGTGPQPLPNGVMAFPRHPILNIIGGTVAEDVPNNRINLTLGGGGEGGGYATIESAGAPLPQETTVNFVGFDAVDDSADARTNVTLNFANASAIGILPVPRGGLGVGTLAAHGVLVGEGASPVAVVGPGAAGLPLLGAGGSADPAFAILGVVGGGTGLATVGANGTVLTVVSGVPAWAAAAGGSFTAAGDLSGSSSTQEVIGILSHALPSLTAGFLQWTGSAWALSTPSGTFTAGGDLTGSSVSQEVLGLLSHALPSLTAGFLQWTGTAWAFGSPSGAFSAGGDLSGTSSSQEVVGVLNHALPALSAGVLAWNGTAWLFTATGNLFTAGGDLAGTTTSQSVVGIRGSAVPTLATGYLNWTGSAWAFTTPVTSLTAGTGISISGSTGVITISSTVTSPTLTNHALVVGQGTAVPAFLAPGVSGHVAVSDGTNWTSAVLAYAQLSGTPTGLPPTGAAGGDLGGSYPSPEVTGLLNHALPALPIGPVALSYTSGGGWAFATYVSSLTAGTGISLSASSGAVTITNTGTAPPTLTAHDLVVGQGTTTPLFLAPGASGHVAVSNGTDWTSAVLAYAQISGTPSALPPNGAAGGDLSGTYPNPTVAQIKGAPVNTPALGAVIFDGSTFNYAFPLTGTFGGTGLTGPGTSGNYLLSNGTAWTSVPAPKTLFSALQAVALSTAATYFVLATITDTAVGTQTYNISASVAVTGDGSNSDHVQYGISVNSTTAVIWAHTLSVDSDFADIGNGSLNFVTTLSGTNTIRLLVRPGTTTTYHADGDMSIIKSVQ